MNNEFFSKRLQQALNFNRMKPIELANKTGIGKSSISYYLSGNYKASQKHLEKIAKALGVNEAWLLGYSDETTLKPIKNIKQPKKKPIKEFNLKVKEIYDIMVDREVNEKIKYTAIHSLIDYVIYDKKNDTIDIYYK
jgi:transcriptional regulator with XRE-family HTH domain